MSDKKFSTNENDNADCRTDRMAPIHSEEKRFVVLDRQEVNDSVLVLPEAAMVDLLDQLQAQGENKAAQVVGELLRRGRALMAEPESYTVDYQCLKCKKFKDQHRAGYCPIPSSSRSFLHHSKTELYEPNLKKPKKVTFII